MRFPFKKIIGAIACFGGFGILLVAGAAAGEVNLSVSWNPSPSDGVAGYQIYYGTASHAYTQTAIVGSTTNATLGGFEVGTTYYIAAVAYDSSGVKSDFSGELAYKIPGVADSKPVAGGNSDNAAAGTYSGLIFAINQTAVQIGKAGSFTILVSSRGAFSGRLQFSSTRYSFSGTLDSLGQATVNISRPGASPMVLQLSPNTAGQSVQVLGTLSADDWVGTLAGNRAVFNARSNPAPYTGRYTVVFPGQTGAPSLPAGDGFGTVRVMSSGQILFAGKLADGTAVSQSATVSEPGAWPLYLSTFSGRGLVIGWLQFAAGVGGDLAGAVNWIKLSSTSSRYYPAGFTNEFQAAGSSYTPPTRPADAILSLNQGTVAFLGGNLASALINSIELGLSSRVTNLGSNRMAMSFSPSTGTFSGSVDEATTGRPMPFGGVVVQKRQAGYGFLLGTDQTSQVVIEQ